MHGRENPEALLAIGQRGYMIDLDCLSVCPLARNAKNEFSLGLAHSNVGGSKVVQVERIAAKIGVKFDHVYLGKSA